MIGNQRNKRLNLILTLYFMTFAKGTENKNVSPRVADDYFPNIPELPAEAENDFLILYSENISAKETDLMARDLLGGALSPLDALGLDFYEQIEYRERTLESGQFEGDISGVYLSQIDDNGSRNGSVEKNAIIHKFQKWPHGEIPYVISSRFSRNHRKTIYKAMKSFEDYSCIRWRPAEEDDVDLVHILRDDGCYSRVGRAGGPQILSLGYGCVEVGTVIHEMLHAAGFWHEQSRPDRNDHVKIQWSNIKSGMEDNFARYSRGEVSTLELNYDTSSIMHYSSKAFSRNGRDTILSVKKGVKELGQSQGFTQLDVMKLNKLYDCEYRMVQDECEDVLRKDICEVLSESHGCSKNLTDYLSQFCPNTCGLCPVRLSYCFDRDERCSEFIKAGKIGGSPCESGSHNMKQLCPKSCGFCKEKVNSGGSQWSPEIQNLISSLILLIMSSLAS